MKYLVRLWNTQGASFEERFDTKQECQEYLNSFQDQKNLTGEVIDNETGIVVAEKKRTRFEWR